jgi:hypothetical protein
MAQEVAKIKVFQRRSRWKTLILARYHINA